VIEKLRVETSNPGHTTGLVRFFAANTAGCYCRFWHCDGWEIEWMERCTQPDRNRNELEQSLARDAVDARGLVARIDDEIVGWLKLAPAITLDKLYGRRPYAKMPCFNDDRRGVYTIACVLVDRAWRRRGIARALVAEAVVTAKRWGATSLEALPRRGTDDPQLLQMGPEPAFLAAGFAVVHESISAHPVLRRRL
jgi:GNAT superfamily N-acetyltransferase